MFYLGKRIARDQTLEVRSPYDGALIDSVAEFQKEDIAPILATARKGAELMRNMSAGERAAILERAAERLAHNEEIAQLLCLEVGKHIREARMEVYRAAGTLRAAATAARTLSGETIPMDLLNLSNKIAFYQRVPVGIVLAITPFNFPINLACHKVGPAIAGGNAILLKPATKTPLATMKYAQMLIECGLPPEAITVVVGRGGALIEELVAHPDIRKISFTGSPEVGERLVRLGGLKKVTTELGSNAAVIVDEGIDPREAARRIAAGAFGCCGQICISIQRVFAHKSICSELIAHLVEEAKTRKMGNPMDEANTNGCMISESAAARAVSWVKEAERAGATVHCGGTKEGSVMQATVLYNVSSDSKLMLDEVFAPVVFVNAFSDLSDAIAMVNRSPYGLQNALFSTQLNHIMQCIGEIESGALLINESPTFRADNMPYGGMKRSGIGREGPEFAVQEMTEIKLVVIDSWNSQT